VFYGKPKIMDKTDQAVSSEPGYSSNMTNLSVKKKEKLAA
jgi:hypothetical protein